MTVERRQKQAKWRIVATWSEIRLLMAPVFGLPMRSALSLASEEVPGQLAGVLRWSTPSAICIQCPTDACPSAPRKMRAEKLCTHLGPRMAPRSQVPGYEPARPRCRAHHDERGRDAICSSPTTSCRSPRLIVLSHQANSGCGISSRTGHIPFNGAKTPGSSIRASPPHRAHAAALLFQGRRRPPRGLTRTGRTSRVSTQAASAHQNTPAPPALFTEPRTREICASRFSGGPRARKNRTRGPTASKDAVMGGSAREHAALDLRARSSSAEPSLFDRLLPQMRCELRRWALVDPVQYEIGPLLRPTLVDGPRAVGAHDTLAVYGGVPWAPWTHPPIATSPHHCKLICAVTRHMMSIRPLLWTIVWRFTIDVDVDVDERCCDPPRSRPPVFDRSAHNATTPRTPTTSKFTPPHSARPHPSRGLGRTYRDVPPLKSANAIDMSIIRHMSTAEHPDYGDGSLGSGAPVGRRNQWREASCSNSNATVLWRSPSTTAPSWRGRA
ncbi:hypothetical protein C8Q77DRAFT_378644 [Trametes polyzona]|nr:hypothetical protein C8Q77DRAFT_378644 [Trametes polyzona]